MPILPGLAVVFVGIAGGGHAKVDKQVASVVRELHVAKKALPESALRTLTRHKDGTKKIVQKLHSDGVVSFEVVGGHDLRLVTYDGKGDMKTYLEFSLSGGALAADDIGTLKDSIEGDFAGLQHEAPAPVQVAKAEPEAEIEMDPTPTPAPAKQMPTVNKASSRPVIAAKPAAAPKPATPSLDGDDEVPAALGGKAVATTAPRAPEETHEAKPVETANADADAVSLDEVEAMTSGDGGGGGGNEDTSLHASGTADSLHIGASAGVGIAGRLFSPGPSNVIGYSSNPVGLVQFQGHVDPTAHWQLAVAAETTLAMSTPMVTGMAPTRMSRWEATAGYKLAAGRFEIAPQAGFGRRTFSIDSTDPSRSPDGDYNYLIAGAKASTPITDHISVQGLALFEPVVSGTEPTEMALGDASRWAIDFGLGVELHYTHVFARVGGDWQRFQWSWDQAGSRGAGGAVDNYASGTLSVGAVY